MKTDKDFVHFTDKYLLAPTNPVTVNLIGAGGTGSQVLTGLARINQSLIALDHPGLFVRLFDDDIVTRANMGRQLFAQCELGLPKAAALINRVNRFFGTNWKAVCNKFPGNRTGTLDLGSNLVISCVDTVETRFEIAQTLRKLKSSTSDPYRPIYWMDFGNGKSTGQAILSTISRVKQPPSKKYNTVEQLPFVTEEFKTILETINDSDTPSCSISAALAKQDLFINSSLCDFGSSLLWSLFREGMIHYRGFFLNLSQYRSQPIPITQYHTL